MVPAKWLISGRRPTPHGRMVTRAERLSLGKDVRANRCSSAIVSPITVSDCMRNTRRPGPHRQRGPPGYRFRLSSMMGASVPPRLTQTPKTGPLPLPFPKEPTWPSQRVHPLTKSQAEATRNNPLFTRMVVCQSPCRLQARSTPAVTLCSESFRSH